MFAPVECIVTALHLTVMVDDQPVILNKGTHILLGPFEVVAWQDRVQILGPDDAKDPSAVLARSPERLKFSPVEEAELMRLVQPDFDRSRHIAAARAKTENKVSAPPSGDIIQGASDEEESTREEEKGNEVDND